MSKKKKLNNSIKRNLIMKEGEQQIKNANGVLHIKSCQVITAFAVGEREDIKGKVQVYCIYFWSSFNISILENAPDMFFYKK